MAEDILPEMNLVCSNNKLSSWSKHGEHGMEDTRQKQHM